MIQTNVTKSCLKTVILEHNAIFKILCTNYHSYSTSNMKKTLCLKEFSWILMLRSMFHCVYFSIFQNSCVFKPFLYPFNLPALFNAIKILAQLQRV